MKYNIHVGLTYLPDTKSPIALAEQHRGWHQKHQSDDNARQINFHRHRKTNQHPNINNSSGDCNMIAKGVVGTKGELLPPKRIRDRLHLKSGSTVIYRVDVSRLIIEPVPDILTAIKLPKFGKTTIDEFEKERHELAREVSRR